MKLNLKLEEFIILFFDKNKIIKYIEIYDSRVISSNRTIFFLHRSFSKDDHKSEIRRYKRYFEENEDDMQYGLFALFHDAFGEVGFPCKFKKNSIEVDFKL